MSSRAKSVRTRPHRNVGSISRPPETWSSDVRLATAPTPRYYRVLMAIENWIRDGVYVPAERIPTEAQLCRSFEVSRITVRRALDELQRRGWLTRQQGRGTFVAPDLRPHPVPVNWSDVMHSVADFSQATAARDTRVATVSPDAATRAALRITGPGRVQRITHVRLLRGEPLGFITNWVPEDVAGRISSTDLLRAPTLTLLEKSGTRIGDSQQSIGATIATARLARMLDVPVGAPLVRLERVVYDDTGRGVDRVLALYRADRYQYRMALTRRDVPTAGLAAPQRG